MCPSKTATSDRLRCCQHQRDCQADEHGHLGLSRESECLVTLKVNERNVLQGRHPILAYGQQQRQRLTNVT